MNVGYKKRFLRDLEKLPESVNQRVQEIAFSELPEVDDIQQISGLKKLMGKWPVIPRDVGHCTSSDRKGDRFTQEEFSFASGKSQIFFGPKRPKNI